MSDYIGLIQVVCGAFLAGGFALFGAWLNNRSNNIRLSMQLAHETKKAKSNLMIDRGEELYLLMVKWRKMVNSIDSDEMQVVRKFITREQFNERQLSSDRKPDFDRMETLMSIYFPDIMSLFDESRQMRTPINNITFELDGSEKLTESEKVAIILDCGRKFSKKMDEVLTKIKSDLSPFVGDMTVQL